MKLELSVHACKLKNVAGALKGTSDPFVIVTKIATEKGAKAEVVGKSEVIKNNLNPNWVKAFFLDFELGQTTKVAISIFDEVRKGDNKSMGSAVFDVAEILAARGSTKGKKIKGGGT
jgi:Ca2+-dependent lipid-binding protein